MFIAHVACNSMFSGRGPEIEVRIDSVPFFDLGAFFGVKELERVEDSNSDPIFIPGGIIMGNQIVSTVYVRQTDQYCIHV